MKSPKGTGSITQLEKGIPRAKCRKWRLRVSLGTNPLDKKRDERTKRFTGTYTNAQKELRAFIAELDDGTNQDTRNIRFQPYAKQWYDERKLNGDVSPGTLRKNRVHVRTLTSMVGNMKLRDITPDVVTSVYLALRSGEGSLSGKPLSGTSTRGIAIALHQIMERAALSDIILKNPCDKVPMPKVDTKEKEALPIKKAQELAGKLTAEKPDAHRVAVLLALLCGLRMEEALGLSWSDFDVKKGTLRLRQVRTAENEPLRAPKTEKSKRTMPLHPSLEKYLNEWKALQADKFHLKGLQQTGDTPIAANAIGKSMHPNNFRKWWNKWREKNGFSGLMPHQLRHTFATYLVSENTDIITSKRLMGHSDSKMLLDIYAHTIDDNLVKAAHAVGDSIMNGTK